MVIAREEIFGPVISVIALRRRRQGHRHRQRLRLRPGWFGGTADVERGIAISEKIRTGTFWRQLTPSTRPCPFGGYKNSGIGRECGPEGLEAFSSTSQRCLPAIRVPQDS